VNAGARGHRQHPGTPWFSCARAAAGIQAGGARSRRGGVWHPPHRGV